MGKPKTYVSENVLEEFYKALTDGDSSRLERVHIPRSDVFYAREAIYHATGIRYTLDRVERAMFLEGMLPKSQIFDPDRDWEYDPEDGIAPRRRCEGS